MTIMQVHDRIPTAARWRRLSTCFRVAGVLAVLGALTTPTAVAALQSHDGIRSAAARHAIDLGRTIAPGSAQVRAEAARLDPRLQLVACPAPIETFSPPGQRPAARLSVGVRCPAAGWSLYVPVRLEILTSVVVLTSAVARGEALTPRHIALEKRDVAALPAGYLGALDDAAHMVARRGLPGGTLLTPSVVEPEKLVRRGQRVRLVSTAAAFAVEADGEAMGDAARGERVRVRNLRSRQIVEGVVDDDGTVRIGAGPVTGGPARAARGVPELSAIQG